MELRAQHFHSQFCSLDNLELSLLFQIYIIFALSNYRNTFSVLK